MNLLLDTMTIIYLVQQPDSIPTPTRIVLEDPRNDLYISMVSPWEMQIKVSLGKLTLGQSVLKTISNEVVHRRISLLPITLDHIDALSQLPAHHRDPFDRLLIAQAVVDGLTVATSDQQIRRYSIQSIWD